MVENALPKRGIEILNTGIAIYNLASSKDIKELDILHMTKKDFEVTLERVIMIQKDNTIALTRGE